MQGTLTVTFTEWVCVRLIPADAGNTVLVDSGRSYGPAHPRAYGERRMYPTWCARCSGSPPHIRGTHGTPPQPHDLQRLTPAHTGNAFPAAFASTDTSAHPRAYGERFLSVQVRSWRTGSPPRIRGMPGFFLLLAAIVRLTPAHTGNAMQGHCAEVPAPAHPRAYGERGCCGAAG